MPARGKSRHGIRPSLHPGGLRCDSVTYSRYAPSSRLVRRAQERSRCSRDFHHGLIHAATRRALAEIQIFVCSKFLFSIGLGEPWRISEPDNWIFARRLDPEALFPIRVSG